MKKLWGKPGSPARLAVLYGLIVLFSAAVSVTLVFGGYTLYRSIFS
jgi:hypothetical protein